MNRLYRYREEDIPDFSGIEPDFILRNKISTLLKPGDIFAMTSSEREGIVEIWSLKTSESVRKLYIPSCTTCVVLPIG